MELLTAALLKPFVALLIMVGLVLPLALLLQRVIPSGRLKQVLYDTTLFQRRKGLAWIAVLVSYLVLALIYVALGGRWI